MSHFLIASLKSFSIISGKTEYNRKNYQRNEDLELPLFDLATISDATNNFSFDNKLGEGDFGPV